jgi:hypothetical protein
MIQLHPDQGEERDGDAAPRPPINVVYAGSGPATFLSTGLSFELEPDILMPLTTHPQGLWVVPAAEFPVSLPGQQAPSELLKPASADLLDVPEREVWPSEALDERLLRYSGEAAELVLLTTPEYENGWRALLGGAVAIAVLRGLTMPDGAVAVVPRTAPVRNDDCAARVRLQYAPQLVEELHALPRAVQVRQVLEEVRRMSLVNARVRQHPARRGFHEVRQRARLEHPRRAPQVRPRHAGERERVHAVKARSRVRSRTQIQIERSAHHTLSPAAS